MKDWPFPPRPTDCFRCCVENWNGKASRHPEPLCSMKTELSAVVERAHLPHLLLYFLLRYLLSCQLPLSSFSDLKSFADAMLTL